MGRAIAAFLVFILLIGAAPQSAKVPKGFTILGASVDISVDRDGVSLPATVVPYLKPGDVLEISFPKGVQFSRSPRWHLVAAQMYNDYLQHPPTFPIPDADLSRAKPGTTWSVPVIEGASPLLFLVPEDGGRYGHGIPEARAAITELANRALLARTAKLSASAQVKASTMDDFLKSLASIKPGEVADGRARVANATQSLFGSDLGDSSCFTTTVAQSTQYACAANAVAAGYGSTPSVGVGAVIGDNLSIGLATYGMLIGTIYALLAKRHPAAHYVFIPGTIEPGGKNTNVYVAEQPTYDASAAKPSSIVYFTVGSRATSPKAASYGKVPALPVCLADRTLSFDVPFTGLPIYFRSHTVSVKTAAHSSFDVAAKYDPVRGYRADLSEEQFQQLGNGGTATLSSAWGFDTVTTGSIAIVEPRAVQWTLKDRAAVNVVAGDRNSTLTFTDGDAHQAGCVQSVAVTDGLGRAIPVTKLERTDDGVTVTLDASRAGGANGRAVIREANKVTTAPIAFSVYPALPSITSAIAYLPKGLLVLKGSGLKYINTVSLEGTGITFGAGTPRRDGSWIFEAQDPTSFKTAWEHETMAISFTLQPPDPRTDAVEADVEYAASPKPSPSPSPSASPSPSPRPSPALTPAPAPTHS